MANIRTAYIYMCVCVCVCVCACARALAHARGQHSGPQFHLPPLGSLASWHLVAKVGTSKRGGKQWQITPKDVPRMHRTRAIPFARLSSGLCPNRPKGWVPIIIIPYIYAMSFINRMELIFTTMIFWYPLHLWNVLYQGSAFYLHCAGRAP